jgi:hypothetical protein
MVLSRIHAVFSVSSSRALDIVDELLIDFPQSSRQNVKTVSC